MKSNSYLNEGHRLCKRMACVGAVILFCLASGAAAQTTPELGIRDKTPTKRAFVNARIFVSPEVTIDTGTLIIGDGKVLAAGRGIQIPGGIPVTDLRGKTIYPGFIEPFSDYGLPRVERRPINRTQPPQYTTGRIGGNTWNGAIHAEVDWSASFAYDEKASKELLQLGFTMVQSARMDGVLRGRSLVALLGEGIPNDLIVRPKGWHFASFHKGSSEQEYPSSLMGSIALIRQILYDVDWYEKAHQAYRLNPLQKMPEFNAAIENLAGVFQERVIFDAGPDGLSVLRAYRLGKEFNLPVVIMASGTEYACLSEVSAAGATLIVPLNFPKPPEINSAEDDLDLSLARLRHWDTAPSNPARLEKSGVIFALTTHRLDEKKSFRQNLKRAIDRGLSPSAALAALTVIPAEICGVADQAGTLSSGKLANFIVCDGDIFDPETDIYSVFVAGKENVILTPSPDFAGNYQLAFDSRAMTLQLSGKPHKLKGEVKEGDKNLILTNVAADRNGLSFSLPVDTAAGAELIRFSGRKETDTIAGFCLFPDGRRTPWTARIEKGIAPDTGIAEGETIEEKPETVDTVLARLTYPNKAFGVTAPPEQKDVLIKNATVWTAEDRGILQNTDILVEKGKFAKIGNNLTAPAGILVIDAAGKHVSPGIIDAHSHIAASGDVNEGTLAVTPETRIADIIDPEDIHIYRQLAGGVTGSFILHGSANPIGAQCQAIKMKWGSGSEELKNEKAPPTIKFALGENVKQSNWGDRFSSRYPQTRMGSDAIIDDAFQAAKEYRQQRLAFEEMDKKKQRLTVPPRRDLGLEALAEVINGERIVRCHAYVQTEALMLMRTAEKYGFTIGAFEHMLEGYKIADEMARHGAGAATFPDWWAYKFEVYDAIPYNAALMVERGVVTAIKSDDVEMARRLPMEAGKSILYGGMSSEEAIKMVTINPARLLRLDTYTGSIAVGKEADFVIWNGNPLSVYSRVEQTWIEGRKYFDRQDDARRRRDDDAEKRALIQKVMKFSEGK